MNWLLISTIKNKLITKNEIFYVPKEIVFAVLAVIVIVLIIIFIRKKRK